MFFGLSLSVALQPHLVSKPTILVRSWTQPKVVELVTALQHRDISTRAALEDAWYIE